MLLIYIDVSIFISFDRFGSIQTVFPAQAGGELSASKKTAIRQVLVLYSQASCWGFSLGS